MANPETILGSSPADFNSSMAYALHGDMRRLLITAIVGSLLLPIGMAEFLQPQFFFEGTGELLVRRLVGLLVALGGATLLFGGLVGALFKLVTDAMILAHAQ